MLRRVEMAGMKRKERREMERRWRKEKERAVPSASAVFRYLAGFHEEEERVVGKAIIPRSNEHLQGLQRVNEELVGWLQKHEGEKTATLDMDATLVETTKAEALYCYNADRSAGFSSNRREHMCGVREKLHLEACFIGRLGRAFESQPFDLQLALIDRGLQELSY